jgi:hypothetical protein
MMLIIIQYPLAFYYVFTLLFKHSLRQFILCHLRLFSFFSACHKVLHPYKNWRRNMLYKKPLVYCNMCICLQLIFPVMCKIYSDNILFWESAEAVSKGTWFPKVDSVQWYSRALQKRLDLNQTLRKTKQACFQYKQFTVLFMRFIRLVPLQTLSILLLEKNIKLYFSATSI